MQQASGPATTVDRNGNEISVSGGVFTDTLNTTALTVAGGGTPASPIRLSYVNASGSTSTYTVNYASYQVQTNFGCSTVGDTNAGQQYLISSITLPDGTSYTFTYEPTPSFSGYTTGRLASVKLPAGGTISYGYSGGGTGVNGITCADGTPATLTRITPDSGTGWQYAHTEYGTNWATVITAPPIGTSQPNQTSMTFQSVTTTDPSSGLGGITYAYPTGSMTYQGSAGGTPLQTVYTCYNGDSAPCSNTTILATALPFSQVGVTAALGAAGGTTQQNYVSTLYNSYGLPTDVRQYDYGSGAFGSLLQHTTIQYDTSLGAIVNMPSEVSVLNGSGTLASRQKYTYDAGTPTSTLGTRISRFSRP